MVPTRYKYTQINVAVAVSGSVPKVLLRPDEKLSMLPIAPSVPTLWCLRKGNYRDLPPFSFCWGTCIIDACSIINLTSLWKPSIQVGQSYYKIMGEWIFGIFDILVMLVSILGCWKLQEWDFGRFGLWKTSINDVTLASCCLKSLRSQGSTYQEMFNCPSSKISHYSIQIISLA